MQHKIEMHKIQISMNDPGLVAQMRLMRRWLDERRFQPSGFQYEQRRDRVLVRVAFSVEHEARAFAAHFNGWSVVE
jgi:hypothetical protein